MTIRYGIIGTGMMGCEHIRNLAAMDDVEVVAIADPNEKPRKWAQKACGERYTPRIHARYQDILAADDVDALVIATPNYTHADLMRDVFETDKHVMLEKPMCTTIRDAEEVYTRGLQHTGIVWIGLEYRYMAPLTAMLTNLHQVGTVHMCAIREHRFPFLKKVGNWNRFNRNTGGTLVEKCCHFFDMMNQVIPSTPHRIFASGGQDVNHLDEEYEGQRPDIIDNAYVMIDYENGAQAMLDLCMFAEGGRYEQQIVVTGNVGRMETTVPGNELLISNRTRNSYVSIPVEPDQRVREEGMHHGASYLEHLRFRDAIINNTPAEVTLKDGLLSVAMGVAGQCSIETGQPIFLQDLLEVRL